MTCKCKQLKAYIEQEKFNWQLDRERADGAEKALADTRKPLEPVHHILGIEHLGQLKSTVFAIKDQLAERKPELVKLKRTIEKYRALKIHRDVPTHYQEETTRLRAKLKELREAVAWHFECLGLIKYCESFSPFPADRLSINWCGHEELHEILEHAEQQLRDLTGGEDGGSV